MLPAAALVSPQLLKPTRLTAADDRLRALADGLREPDDTPLESAQRVCDAVHAAISYEYGVTTVRTTAGEALSLGRGVCQDSAHVMLALCHLLGLPARYVSGHLLGQGGTHAWVEVIVARADDAMAVAFDPCNGGRRARATSRSRPAGTTATWRRSGSYSGSSRGRLTANRRVGVLAVA